MAALKHIQLTSCQQHSGVGKTSGKPYTYLALQGLMHYEDGTSDVFVYDFWPRADEPMPDFKPGNYLPVIEPRPDWRTRKLEAFIVALRPLVAVRAAAAG